MRRIDCQLKINIERTENDKWNQQNYIIYEDSFGQVFVNIGFEGKQSCNNVFHGWEFLAKKLC